MSSCESPGERIELRTTSGEAVRIPGRALPADIQAPDFETRSAILRAKAEESAVPIGSDVSEFIARKVVSNIRELEGALNRVVAYAFVLTTDAYPPFSLSA